MKKGLIFSEAFHSAFHQLGSDKTIPAIAKVAIAEMRNRFAADEKVITEVRTGLLDHYAEKDATGKPITYAEGNALRYNISPENAAKVEEDLKPVMDQEIEVQGIPLANLGDLQGLDATSLSVLMEAGIVVKG